MAGISGWLAFASRVLPKAIHANNSPNHERQSTQPKCAHAELPLVNDVPRCRLL